MASEAIMEVGEANFSKVVEASQAAVLLDFWASWCGPCRALAPIVDEIATEMKGQLVVGKVNTDDEGSLAMKYGIRSIPTMIVFKGGKEVERIIGLRSKEEILSAIRPHL